MKHPLLLPLFALALCACGGDDDDNIKFGPDTPATTPTTRPTSAEAVSRRLEVPARRADGTFVSHWTLEGTDSTMTYCLEYDAAKQHSRWVAYRFDATTRRRTVSRTDAWADDPQLPASMQIGTAYFQGYSRGHICPSADRLYSRQANEQTFYMSNMSPQLSGFNSGAWFNLESLVRTKGQSAAFADTLYVVKGGTINEAQILRYVSRADGKRVAVPQYYFTALLRVKNGTYAAIAFLLPHRTYSQSEAEDLSAFALTVDELEEFTGIDFFPNLPDPVERAVEAAYTSALWL